MALSQAGNYGGQFPGLQLKAWAIISSTGTLIKGFNVSSTSRASIGAYLLNFTSPMATANYICDVKSNDPLNLNGMQNACQNKTLNQCNVYALTAGAYVDAQTYVAVYE